MATIYEWWNDRRAMEALAPQTAINAALDAEAEARSVTRAELERLAADA